jgi:nucleotide-binding universal stress UspA family protein
MANARHFRMSDESPIAERRIVVAGIDFSPIGELALEHVLELASEDVTVEPHFVHVASAYGPLLRLEVGDEQRSMTVERASELLRCHIEQHVSRLRGRRPVHFDRAITHIRVGAPNDEIAQLAIDLDADLIVVGTHGRRGLRRMLLGSVAEGVIRLAHCPVYVVRPKQDPARSLSGPTPLLPPCQRCIQIRSETLGERLWCNEHAARRPGGEVRARLPARPS